MKKKRAVKTKRVMTAPQKKALKRNWCKGLITCNIKHIEQITENKSLSFPEQMKILKCKRIFEELLKEWEPVL